MAALNGDQQFQEMALEGGAPPQEVLMHPPPGGVMQPPQDVLAGPEGQIPQEQPMMVSHPMSLSP